MNTMRHGEYLAKIEFDEDMGMFHGRVVNTGQVITFYGASVEELQREFVASVEAHLDFCRRKGIAPGKAFSGQFRLRRTPEQHSNVAAAAACEDRSMNEWVAETIDRAAMEILLRR